VGQAGGEGGRSPSAGDVARDDDHGAATLPQLRPRPSERLRGPLAVQEAPLSGPPDEAAERVRDAVAGEGAGRPRGDHPAEREVADDAEEARDDQPALARERREDAVAER